MVRLFHLYAILSSHDEQNATFTWCINERGGAFINMRGIFLMLLSK